MKNNITKGKFYKAYFAGFLIILALPILTIPPYFFPADWGKSIAFRSVMAVLLFLSVGQFLFKKNEISLLNLKNNKIAWALGALFAVYLLASIFSADPLFSFWGSPYRGGGFVTFAFFFAFALLAFILFKKPDWKKAFDFSIFIGILVSLVAVIQYFGLFAKIFLPSTSRPPSTMGNPVLLATYILLLFFLTFSFALKEPLRIKKIFYFFSLALFSYVILISGARAVYFGLFISLIYFLIFYPKKMKAVKIFAAVLLILLVGFVFYINVTDQYPKFLQQNKFFISITSRLSMRLLLMDPRFYAWTGVDYKILTEKPVLGYGPENFSIGFDKFYDPSIPYLNQNWGDWWDRAHDIFIQTASDAGVLGIMAYLALFIILFWQLQKTKNAENKIIPHAIQATLIGYLVANFFGFDSFSTYLIFFLLIGYSLHLIYENTETKPASAENFGVAKKIFLVFAFCVLAVFLWQYNFVPFLINAEINKAQDLANAKQCGQSIALTDKVLPQHSFLDSYVRMEYVEFTKTCANFYPENNLTYIKKDLELIKEAVKIQPLYTRYWIFLGSSAAVMAGQEQNPEAKNNLLKEAKTYFDKALQLAPKHQEIFIELAKMEIISGDYKKMQEYSEKCVALNPGLGDCYFYLGLSKIYMKDYRGAEKDMQTAQNKIYNIELKPNLLLMSDAYGYLEDYKNLAIIYEKLIKISPEIAQYHSSLAFFYAKLGRYAEARQEALKVLQLSPESKPNVDEFLKTLP